MHWLRDRCTVLVMETTTTHKQTFETVMERVETVRLTAARTPLGRQLAAAEEAAWKRRATSCSAALITAARLAADSKHEEISDQAWALELAEWELCYGNDIDWGRVRSMIWQAMEANEITVRDALAA